MRTITHHALICVSLVALLAACGEKEDDGRLKVGYVVNFMSHEWYQNICRAAEARAVQLDVDIVIADANLDIAAQVSKAENLIAQGVDVLVLTPVDAKALGPVVAEANRRGIHVLTESNPVEGSLSYVGIDNKAAGKKAGLWYGAYAREHGIDSKILIIGLPNFEDCRLRADGFKEGLADSGVDYDIVQEVDGQGLKERALKVAQDALTQTLMSTSYSASMTTRQPAAWRRTEPPAATRIHSWPSASASKGPWGERLCSPVSAIALPWACFPSSSELLSSTRRSRSPAGRRCPRITRRRR